MPLYTYKTFTPTLGKDTFVAPSCDLIGQVTLKDRANLWFGVVARGDMNEIVVGQGSNIQDLSMLHVTEELPLIIGDGVSVGHKAILHACTVGEYSLVGMGAILLDAAVISSHSVVAAGSVVPPGKKYPPYSMIMGNPARVVRQLKPEEIDLYGDHYKIYEDLKKEFQDPVLFTESS